MTLVTLRRKAIGLRLLGKSYGQIKQEIKVSKSTLSEWLKKYPLTVDQLKKIKSENEEYRIEKYRQTMFSKREKKLKEYYKKQKDLLLPLSSRELLIAGIFLYWGEGTKSLRSQLVISNTDPALVQFALFWMIQGLGIPREKIQVLIHLYNDMNIKDSLDYWSSLLNIPLSQFAKPYIKKSNRVTIDYKGFGYGTCNLRVFNTEIKERILMTLEVMRDYSKESVQNLL